MTTKQAIWIAAGVAAALASQSADAAAAAPIKPGFSTKIGVSTEATDFSGPYGTRRESTVDTSFDLGRTTFALSASHGSRKFESESFKGNQLSGSVYHDWSDRWSSRTAVSLADKSPVYARRELAQDISFKVAPNVLLTAGGKYARYFGGIDVASLSAGGSLYFRGGFATYRFGVHDVDGRGHQYSHLASFRLKDPRGSGQTQLWLAAGTALQEQEILGAGRQGKYRGLQLQRVQPIAGPVALSFGLGRTWFDTPAGDYHGTKATIGLTVNR